MQGSEQELPLAASYQHAAHCGATAPSRREAAGSQEGSWSAVRLLGSALRSQGALQDPQPTRPRFPHRREMGGGFELSAQTTLAAWNSKQLLCEGHR